MTNPHHQPQQTFIIETITRKDHIYNFLYQNELLYVICQFHRKIATVEAKSSRVSAEVIKRRRDNDISPRKDSGKKYIQEKYETGSYCVFIEKL